MAPLNIGIGMAWYREGLASTRPTPQNNPLSPPLQRLPGRSGGIYAARSGATNPHSVIGSGKIKSIREK
jgi:hypothetical protein